MERDKNNDLELAVYIWSILKSNLPSLCLGELRLKQ